MSIFNGCRTNLEFLQFIRYASRYRAEILHKNNLDFHLIMKQKI